MQHQPPSHPHSHPNSRPRSQRGSPPRLLSVDQVRASLLAEDPTYGDGLTDQDWEGITERLEALARLLWEFSRRRAGRPNGAHAPADLRAATNPPIAPADPDARRG